MTCRLLSDPWVGGTQGLQCRIPPPPGSISFYFWPFFFTDSSGPWKPKCRGFQACGKLQASWIKFSRGVLLSDLQVIDPVITAAESFVGRRGSWMGCRVMSLDNIAFSKDRKLSLPASGRLEKASPIGMQIIILVGKSERLINQVSY